MTAPYCRRAGGRPVAYRPPYVKGPAGTEFHTPAVVRAWVR